MRRRTVVWLLLFSSLALLVRDRVVVAVVAGADDAGEQFGSGPEFASQGQQPPSARRFFAGTQRGGGPLTGCLIDRYQTVDRTTMTGACLSHTFAIPDQIRDYAYYCETYDMTTAVAVWDCVIDGQRRPGWVVVPKGPQASLQVGSGFAAEPQVARLLRQVSHYQASLIGHRELSSLAFTGDVAAQIVMGDISYFGGPTFAIFGREVTIDGQQRDPIAAERWWRRAAERKSVQALLRIAAVEFDTSVHPEAGTADPTSVGSLKQAADAGDLDALHLLGACLETGALKDAEHSVVAGLPWSLTTAIPLRLTCPRNVRRALDTYNAAAQRGHQPSVQALGRFGLSATIVGQTFDPLIVARIALNAGDLNAAFESYKVAADGGSAEAQLFVGLSYRDGMPVIKDEAAAFAYLSRAADQGLVDAKVHVGVLYRDGRGVAADATKALTIFREAERQGSPAASYNLGDMYERGIAVPRDPKRALAYFESGAKGGDPSALSVLGIKYLAGDGVLKNRGTAYLLLSEAAEKGDRRAKSLTGMLAAQLFLGMLANAEGPSCSSCGQQCSVSAGIGPFDAPNRDYFSCSTICNGLCTSR